MRFLLGLCGLLVGLSTSPQEAQPDAAPDDISKERAEGAAPAALTVDWSDEYPPLVVPRDETLVFRVRAGVGGLAASVGSVRMESRVEPYRESVLLTGAGSGAPERESGRMRIRAVGDYQLFTIRANIETLAHPKRWPFLVSNFTQSGTKDRRKETVLGWKGESSHARYRKDTTKGAPKGSRIWGEPKERDLPVPALDMVSASYFSRVMATEERLFMQFPVADKLDLWQITLRRGKTGRVETAAGTFEAVQLLLEPKPYPGEVADDKVKEKAESFQGLFGLHGSITIWMEKETGVPILISGDLPVGPVTIAVSVALESYSGTPPAFRPIS